MKKDLNKREIAVGFFVVVSLAVLFVLIFLIGSRQKFFQPQYELKAVFNKVAGLKKGSDVSLAGISVGKVKSVEFSTEARVVVKMTILKKYQSRIRSDSVARINQSGVLGDYMLEITPGKHIYPELQSGEFIDTEEYRDLYDLIQLTMPSLENLEQTFANISDFSNTLRDPEGDFMQIIKNIRFVTQNLREGKGSLGALITDDTAYNKFTSLIEGGGQAVDDINQITKEVQDFTGDLPQFSDRGNATLDKVDGVLEKLDRFADNLEQASEKLPELIVSGQDAVDDAKSVIEGVKLSPAYRRFFSPPEQEPLIVPQRVNPYQESSGEGK